MTIPVGPFSKVCAWCREPFLAKHSTIKCCSKPCRERHARRRVRQHWRKFYRDNHDRLQAYYKAYHLKNREQRIARQRAYMRRRWAAMTEAEREALRAKRRASERKMRFVRKVAEQWHVGLPEARRMIEIGSFPP